MVNGSWSGNGYGAWARRATVGYGGVGAWGTGSPMYGWGYSGYSNPYSAGYAGAGVGAQAVAPQQSRGSAAYNYSQPISTTAPPPEQAVASQSSSALDQARDAFKAGDYGKASQLDQQALAQTPNDTSLHEFLGLVYFAQGKYDQAAEPLYAVLSVGPGWDWTTVERNVSRRRDLHRVSSGPWRQASGQTRNSAHARFVLAYQYLVPGARPERRRPVEGGREAPARRHPLGAAHRAPSSPPAPPSRHPPRRPRAPAPADLGKLAGSWTATPAKDAKVALAIKEDGKFSWDAIGPGKPPTAIAGTSTFADGVLTLAAQGTQDGALAGKVAWQDADHFTFRLVGAPANDPGLKFAR